MSADVLQIEGSEITADEAQAAILDFLSQRRGQVTRQWEMLNQLAVHPINGEMKRKRLFYLLQLGQLIKQRKVIRYRKGLLRGKIRISEAYA